MNIFVSYTTKNRSQVHKAAVHLRSIGLTPFLDWQTIAPGDLWPEKLEKALISCRMALVFLGAETGPWQKREIYYLLNQSVSDDTAIIPILLENAEPPIGLLGLHQWLDWRSGIGIEQYKQLESVLKNSGASSMPEENAAHKLNVNPFRGEMSYREVDGNLGIRHKFFSAREDETDRLVDLIGAPYGGMIQLVGEPGIGKTSFINAGVIPALKRPRLRYPGYIQDQYSVAHVQIDHNPFRALAAALSRADSTLQSDQAIDRTELSLRIEQGLREKPGFLEAYLTQWFDDNHTGPNRQKALIVMHGAENLWDIERSKCRQFEGMLRRATEDQRIRVVFSTTKDLPFLASDRPLPVIHDLQYKEIIFEPAKAAGIYVEDSVVERLVNEAQSVRSLQRRLSQVWANRNGPVLDSAALLKGWLG